MILTCPSCTTRYFVADEAVGAQGRAVRCQACGHNWRAQAEVPLELTATPIDDTVETSAPQAEAERQAPETLAETPAPELPKAYRARAETARRTRRAALHGMAWAGVASLFLGLIGTALLFRIEVVELMPRAAAAYAAVGLPVNVTGLEFEQLEAHALADTADKVRVSGVVRNIRDREIVAVPIRVTLLDEHGAEIARAVIRMGGAPVLPGGTEAFSVVLSDPGGKAAGIGVDFVMAPRPGAAEPADTQAVPVSPPAAPPPERTAPANPAPVTPGASAPAQTADAPPPLRAAAPVSVQTPSQLGPEAAIPLDSPAP